MKKGLVYIACIVGSMLLCLYMISNISDFLPQLSKKEEYLMSFWSFIFGMLMEWKSLFRIIHGDLKMEWKLFILALLLTIICAIPQSDWYIWFGLDAPFYIEILRKSETHLLLTALCGLLLMRSLSSSEGNRDQITS